MILGLGGGDLICAGLGNGKSLVNGGRGDDLLVGDLPGPPETGFLPPTPDPTAQFDT